MITIVSIRRSGTHFVSRALRGNAEAVHVNSLTEEPTGKIVIPIRHPELVMRSWVNRGAGLDNFEKAWQKLDLLMPTSFLFDLERKNFDGLEAFVGFKVDRDESKIGHPNDIGHTKKGKLDRKMLKRIMNLPNVKEFF